MNSRSTICFFFFCSILTCFIATFTVDVPPLLTLSLIHISFCDILRYLSSVPHLLRNIPNILAIPSTFLVVVNVIRFTILRFQKLTFR